MIKINGLTEREKAATGPLALKEPGSPDWCWQILDGLVHDYKRVEERFHDVETTLEKLIEYEAWKIIPVGHPYGTLNAMLQAEIGVGEKTLADRIQKLRATRNRHTDKVDRDGQRPVGRPKMLDNSETVIQDKAPTGTSAAAFIRRLRKDRPDIHARVLAGELSPHAGMIEAGFRKKRPSQKRSRVELTICRLNQMTKTERRSIWEHLCKEFKN